MAALLVGCGGAGQGAETDPEKAADVEILNEALSRELTGIALYNTAVPRLDGGTASTAGLLRAHAQAYVSAITKAIRGAGGETDAEAAETDLDATGRAALLEAAYAHESAALSLHVEAAPRLFTEAPRTLSTALAAAHAQHLVLLRQELGASPQASLPEPFDTGEIELPPQAPRGER